MTKVLVTGSRDWTDKKVIQDALDNIVLDYDGPYTLIHGECPTGADKIAADYATELKWTVIPEPADWKKYGKSAGPIRNQKMINDHKPNVALAFSLNQSSGTANCVSRLREFKRKKPLILLDIKLFEKNQ
jgi:hypothetical protein